MAQARDEFLKATIELLGKRSAFVCSNPDCRTLTIAPSDADEAKWLYIGKAAHICAAASGGARYRAEMSPEERKSASNGIFLCSNCADMIDKNNGLDFPEPLLQKWRIDHEKWVTANLNKRQFGRQPDVREMLSPKLQVHEVFVNQPVGGEYHTRLQVRVEALVTPTNLHLVAKAASVRQIRLSPPPAGMVSLAYGAGPGFAAADLQRPFGTIDVDILATHPEQIILEWEFQ